MKGVNGYVEIIFMAFPKRFLFGVNGPFMTQNGASLQLWIRCKECFTILYNERGQESHGNDINGVSEKNHIWSNWLVILAQKWYIPITWDLLSGFFYF